MNQPEPQRQNLLEPKFDPNQPPPLCPPKRPIKGLSLATFLLFTGLLFFTHGFHKYSQYSVWDLIAVWVLSFFLLTPGFFFIGVFICAQLRIGGVKYKDYPQLFA